MLVQIFVLLAIISVIYVAGYFLYINLRGFLSELAKKNKFFTFRKAGEIIAIMKGSVPVQWLFEANHYLIFPTNDIVKGRIEYRDRKNKTKGVKITLKDDDLLDKLPSDPIEQEVELRRRKVMQDNGISLSDPRRALIKTLEERLQNDPDFEQQTIRDNTPSWFERWFGVKFIGFSPYAVLEYWFGWVYYGQERKPEGETPSINIGMFARRELIHSLYFAYQNYGLDLVDLETGAGSLQNTVTDAEKIKVNIRVVFSTQTTNPRITLFRLGGVSSAGLWLNAVRTRITDEIRTMITEGNYDLLIGGKSETSGGKEDYLREKIREMLLRLNGITLPSGGTITEFGQAITDIRIVSIELANEDLQEIIDAKFVAVRQVTVNKLGADAAEEEARGKKALAAAILKGEAEGYEAIIDAGGERIRVTEALRNVRVIDRGSMAFMLGPDIIGGPDNNAAVPPKPTQASPPTPAPTPTGNPNPPATP